MPSPTTSRNSLGFEEKRYAVLLGASLVVLTTTVPYLTLVNAFLFAGIILAGGVAVHSAVMRFQVPIAYREAFRIGLLAGLLGGFASEGISWLLIALTGYRPGIESLKLIVDAALRLAAGRPELQEQVQLLLEAEKTAMAPVALNVVDILASMAFSAFFYAPITGLGGMLAVLRLRRQAAKG